MTQLTTLAAAARVYWLLTDNQGSIRDIADNAGAQVAHYMFDAFGNIHSGEPTFTRYLYTGREFDATSGLQYNRNRWYDPTIGRFISEDPIQDGSNWYAYVGNSGPNGTDPYGLAEWYNDGFWDWVNPFAWTTSIGTGLGNRAGNIINLYDPAGAELDEQISAIALSRSAAAGTEAEDFRRNQLLGAKKAARDISTLAEESINFLAGGAQFVSAGAVGTVVSETRISQENHTRSREFGSKTRVSQISRRSRSRR